MTEPMRYRLNPKRRIKIKKHRRMVLFDAAGERKLGHKKFRTWVRRLLTVKDCSH